MYTDQLPPSDIEAEEAVIGSILIDGDSINRVAEKLPPEDFFSERNRLCYKACLSIMERGDAINQITVANELQLTNDLEAISGTSYLSQLVLSTPTSIHIEHYCDLVFRASIMRRLIEAGSDIVSMGYKGTPNVDTTLTDAEELLFQIRSGEQRGDFTHIRSLLDEYMGDRNSEHENQLHSITRVHTGFEDLDAILGNGMQRSDLFILAARPSLGKSTLAFNIARNAASDGACVGIISLEMSKEQIAVRLLSSEAKVNSKNLDIRLLSDRDEARLMDAMGVLSDLPIYVDDAPIQTIMDIRARAKRLKMEYNLDFLVIDYLQLISGTGRSDNRVQEMGEISRSLKALARDLNIPILACSQLNRAIEQRPNHRPQLSDLRESGSIEQDADIVAFIYREDVYTNEDEWQRKFPTQEYPKDIAEIIIAKHRNGPTDTINLHFQRNWVKFESLTANTGFPAQQTSNI